MAFAIDGAGIAAGLVFVDRPVGAAGRGFGTADLREFAFLANGLAAVARIALSRVEGRARRMSDRLLGVRRQAGIITRSAVLGALLDRLERAADCDLPILLSGESGTGKELFARAIHALSPRADLPFVAVHCAAIPEHLLEAELFGHIKGAFTDAGEERRGYFRDAAGGTVFLDEVGEMAAALQAKLFRVLEDRRITALGSTRSVEVDFRVVSATNLDLKAALARGALRSDLYYRLSGLTLTLPPLRERPEDVLLLLEHFLEDGSSDPHTGGLRFSTEARRALERYHWPGNVRELRQVVRSAAALRDPDSARIEIDALPGRIARAAGPRPLARHLDDDLIERIGRAASDVGVNEILRTLQERIEERALAASAGNQRAAARKLSVGESTLRRRMKARRRRVEDAEDVGK